MSNEHFVRRITPHESEFYFGGKDKRKYRGFVTIGREMDGADYEAYLFEQLLNDPKSGEREMHHFFEEHPNFLAEAMMGVSNSHQPYFPTRQADTRFSRSPLLFLALDGEDSVKLGIEGARSERLGQQATLIVALRQPLSKPWPRLTTMQRAFVSF